MVQTEFEFRLLQGYEDEHGTLHSSGVMRLATALDEVIPYKEARVIANPMYLSIIVLSRVIIRIGEIRQINPKVIEKLYAADFYLLQDMYMRINRLGRNRIGVTCPYCEHDYEVEMSPVGE